MINLQKIKYKIQIYLIFNQIYKKNNLFLNKKEKEIKHKLVKF